MDMFNELNIDKINIPAISVYFWKKKIYSFERINKIFLFYRYLYKYRRFEKTKKKIQHKVIKNLEKGCYINTIKIALEQNINCSWEEDDFANIYHFICGRILSYISTDSTDPTKVSNIIDGFIDDSSDYSLSKQFPNKTQKDLYPEQYAEIKRRQIIEQNIKVKASKLRTCPKCKQKLSTTKNRYARSLDEGVDLTATCVFCGFSWAC